MNDPAGAPNDAPIEVGALLEALRVEVRARRAATSAGPDSFARELQRALDEIELHRVVSAHWPLTGRTLPQKAVALVNKLVRRGLRWYINPIVEQQNVYNDTVARAVRLLAEGYEDLREQIDSVAKGRRPAFPFDPSIPPRAVTHTNHAAEGETEEQASGETPREHLPANHTLAPTEGEQGLTAHLQSLLQNRAAVQPPARFPDVALRGLERHLTLRRQVNAHWPLPERTPLERAAAFVHRLQRQYLRWLINPIVEQQNAANAAIAAALLTFVSLDAERRAQVAALRAAGEQESR